MPRRALRIWKLGWPLALLAGACGVLLRAEVVCAQRPKVNTNDVRKIVEARDEMSADEKRTIDAYLNDFFLTLFANPVRPDDLPNLRNRAYKIAVRGAGKTQAHDYLNKQVLTEMSNILVGRDKYKKLPPKYKTAIKYNAMLMIADLNESDELSRVKPLPETLMYLTVVAFTDRLDDYLKPAALIGLARHAQEGAIPKEKVPELTKGLLAIVNQQDPPPGRSASAHGYLRRGAGNVLATLGSPGPKNEVLQAFEAIAVDPNASPMLRCEMVRFIGELKFPEKSNVDFQRLANVLGHQLVEVCRQEIERVREVKSQPASRRLLMYALNSSNTALGTLSSVVDRDSSARDFVYNLKQKVDTLYNAIGDPDETKDESVAGIVETQINEIEDMLGDRPTAALASKAEAGSDKPTN